MEKPWTAYLLDEKGDVTLEFGVVCAFLMLIPWVNRAMQGSTANTTGVLDRCAQCRRTTTFQRRPGAWVPLVAGLSWGALLWTNVPAYVRWPAPFAIWTLLVGLHPKRCALCRTPMGIA